MSSFKLNLNTMDWGQVLTIIFGVTGFMSIFVFLINRQIDMVNRRIDSIDKRIDDLREEVREIKSEIKELRSEIKEIRELLYKVLGAEAKKGD